MKKSIIAAGAASVALAAMPVVSTFAAFTGGSFTDIIQTTVAESCTFGRGTVASHASTGANYHGTGESWDIDQDSTQDPAASLPGTDTLNPAIAVNPAAAGESATETTLGSSKFYVVCNDSDGYQVSVATSSLTNGNADQPTQHPWNYSSSITSPESVTASYWRITPSDAQKPATSPSTTTNYSDIANNIVATKGSAEDGHDFTVSYSAFAITGQNAGTYKATATYTAAQLPAA